ncbi:MAG: ISL3 family transposase [Thioalkalivibrio sp.]|nr:ISL3 family transposase [Thioalkalivibrio sp.]
MSDVSIAPYYPFARVVPVDQQVTAVSETQVQSIITLAPDEGALPICSVCGTEGGRMHMYGTRRVRDLNLAHARVDLVVPNRKMRCAGCGTIRTEGHEFLAPYRRHTLRFEKYVAELCRVMPIKQVAEHVGLSWHAVKEIDKRRLQREVGTPCYDGLRLLAVDEVAVHKGHTYQTIVLDLETGRIVWVGKGRTEATLAGFFAELTPEQRNVIEAVASDMASGFRNAIEKACPQAAQVYDLFHVVAKYSREVVDVVRLDEAKKQDEAGRKLIKGSRYLLLKNAPNLVGSQRKALRQLLDANENLNTVYVLKDQLKRIWNYKHPAWARKALDQWCALAHESGIAALSTFAKNLCRHEKGIVNHCRYPIHTGRLEGINNKIKVIKRQAYGYRDDAYFILKIKGAFPGKLQLNPR